jgi:hypothetical protein
MWILVCSWTVTLRSVTAYLSIILWSAYFLSFAPHPSPSKTLKSKTELVIIQGQKLNRKSFLTMKVEHRNAYNGPYLLSHRAEQNFDGRLLIICGTWCRSWLRHCATSLKVTVSIPDVVTGLFHWHNPSGHTMAMVSTQSQTEMSSE